MWLMILLVATVPGQLWQQRDPRLWARLPASVAGQIQLLADSAARVRLPAEPLIQKALEGHSKGAPGDRIVTAVAALLRALESARSALGPSAVESEIMAGAEWLRAGGTAPHLTGLRRTAPTRQLAAAIAMGTDLMTRGWTENDAAAATDRFLTAKATDRDFLLLRDRIEQAVRAGSSPKAAVLSEVRRLESGDRRP